MNNALDTTKLKMKFKIKFKKRSCLRGKEMKTNRGKTNDII